MQTNDMAVALTNNLETGVQMPLSPPETSRMEGFRDISKMMRNDVTTDPFLSRIPVDKCANPSFDCNPTPSFNAQCDNAVDPNVFLCLNEQQSPNNNLWPPSPYGQLESLADPTPSEPVSPVEKLPRSFPMSMGDAHNLERQISLNVAIELCPVDSQSQLLSGVAFPPTPASSCYTNEDEDYIQHPSPSWYPLNMPSRNRTVSEFDAYLPAQPPADENSRARAVSADLGSLRDIDLEEFFLQCNTPIQKLAADNDQQEPQSINQNNNNNATTSGETSATTSNNECLVSYSQANTTSADAIPVDEESISCLFQGSFGSQDDSLDVRQILHDWENPNHQQKPCEEEQQRVNAVDIIIDHSYTASQEPVIDLASQNNKPSSVTAVVDLTEEPSTSHNAKSTSASSSTPQLKRSSSYVRKRSKNNEACRESRKKRKVEREEAEQKLKYLAEDNEVTRNKIRRLEIEVQETRALLIKSMTKAK